MTEHARNARRVLEVRHPARSGEREQLAGCAAHEGRTLFCLGKDGSPVARQVRRGPHVWFGPSVHATNVSRY